MKPPSHPLRITITSLVALSWLTATLSGQTKTLTFDEVEFQSVDGLTVDGVTFDFKIGGADSTEAFYNSFGPGTLAYIQDPSLTGDAAGILSLEFAIPTAELAFGVALATGENLSPGAQVELFDADSSSVAILGVNTTVTQDLGFSEGLFSYTGTPVARAVVDFADGAGSFSIDNLTYEVPEPSGCGWAIVLWSATAMVYSRLARRGSRPGKNRLGLKQYGNVPSPPRAEERVLG